MLGAVDGESGNIEQAIRAHHERGDLKLAADAAVRAYGAELYRFLLGQLCNTADTDDVSAELWADVWRSLPVFEWRSSFRTWVYVLARRKAAEFLNAPRRRRTRPLSDTQLSQLEAHLRSTFWSRVGRAEDKVAALRASLDARDRALLYLRVDRSLTWEEAAEILLERPASTKEIANLRQEFSRLTKRLRRMAEEAGIDRA